MVASLMVASLMVLETSKVIENPQAGPDTNELKYKEPVNNLVLKDEAPRAIKDKVTSGLEKEVDDLKIDKLALSEGNLKQFEH